MWSHSDSVQAWSPHSKKDKDYMSIMNPQLVKGLNK